MCNKPCRLCELRSKDTLPLSYSVIGMGSQKKCNLRKVPLEVEESKIMDLIGITEGALSSAGGTIDRSPTTKILIKARETLTYSWLKYEYIKIL